MDAHNDGQAMEKWHSAVNHALRACVFDMGMQMRSWSA